MSVEFKARIRRVRMKAGGADVHVIDRQPVNLDGEDWRGRLTLDSRDIGGLGTEDCPLVGYFVMGIFADGATSTGYRYDSARCPIPRTLMPTWIAEIVRRDMITAPDTAELFDAKFEWKEG